MDTTTPDHNIAWDARDLARYLRLHPQTIRNAVAREDFRLVPPPHRIGSGKQRRLRWIPQEVEAWLAAAGPERGRPRSGAFEPSGTSSTSPGAR